MKIARWHKNGRGDLENKTFQKIQTTRLATKRLLRCIEKKLPIKKT